MQITLSTPLETEWLRRKSKMAKRTSFQQTSTLNKQSKQSEFTLGNLRGLQNDVSSEGPCPRVTRFQEWHSLSIWSRSTPQPPLPVASLRRISNFSGTCAVSCVQILHWKCCFGALVFAVLFTSEGFSPRMLSVVCLFFLQEFPHADCSTTTAEPRSYSQLRGSRRLHSD